MVRGFCGTVAWWKQRLGFAEDVVWEAFRADFRGWQTYSLTFAPKTHSRSPRVPHRQYTVLETPVSKLALWLVLKHEWGPKYWGATAQGLLPGAVRYAGDEDELLEKLVAFHNNESRINTGTRRRRPTADFPRGFNRRVDKGKIVFVFHIQNSLPRELPFLGASTASAFEALTIRLCKEGGMGERDLENVACVGYRVETADDMEELTLGKKTGEKGWNTMLRVIMAKDVWQGNLDAPSLVQIGIFVD